MRTMTAEEWEALEPRLAAAERAAHEEYMSAPETVEVLGGTDLTPGYLLLQHLKEAGDQPGIRLFRAMEMYHHEITRADIAAAYAFGKSGGKPAAERPTAGTAD
jgi:hypothetical protein